jgi:subtilisin family serine protease
MTETVPIVRDGRGVRIALIDSGVDQTHPWLKSAVIKHQHVVKKGAGFALLDDEGGDLSGHGTACAGIIHRMAPKAVIVSIRALGDDGRCSRAALLACLRHCIRQRFEVVNLSLGIDVPRKSLLKVSDHRPILTLYELADAAYTVGVVLVASGPNVASFRTYPGRAKALIGVGRGSFDEWDELRTERNQDHEIIAPGTDVVAPALGGGERKWTGTSFATPFVSAHVARILAARPGLSLDRVKASLHAIAKKPDETD